MSTPDLIEAAERAIRPAFRRELKKAPFFDPETAWLRALKKSQPALRKINCDKLNVRFFNSVKRSAFGAARLQPTDILDQPQFLSLFVRRQFRFEPDFIDPFVTDINYGVIEKYCKVSRISKRSIFDRLHTYMHTDHIGLQ
jgi:hypothetical protein